ncbi:hypothetical protein M5K25_018829 [Dendrobium thyrsiflorum]|uniref:Uncharacterized protein n=1 Tax=Dendrobium thyrsiflorum TaxID=117978 RepID=A0ABD0UE31_DENTH
MIPLWIQVMMILKANWGRSFQVHKNALKSAQDRDDPPIVLDDVLQSRLKQSLALEVSTSARRRGSLPASGGSKRSVGFLPASGRSKRSDGSLPASGGSERSSSSLPHRFLVHRVMISTVKDVEGAIGVESRLVIRRRRKKNLLRTLRELSGAISMAAFSLRSTPFRLARPRILHDRHFHWTISEPRVWPSS